MPMDPDEFKAIYGEHEKWLESHGTEGEKADLREADLSQVNLRRAILSGADLVLANLSQSDLSGAYLNGTDMSGASLINANLRGADMRGANLRGADVGWANLSRANLNGANLSGANLNFADLSEADLSNADLHGAYLFWANLCGANLGGANLNDADLNEADLSRANLRGANFTKANVSGIRFSRWSKCKGIRLDGCHGSPRFKRFAQDQEYIEEFRGGDWRGWRFWRQNWRNSLPGWRYWLFYLPWLIFADCGRSLSLWAAWSLVIATSFGFKYHSLGESAFLIAGKESNGVMQSLGFSLETMIYYSVVTFTTLGFGDISPLTHEAARWVMAEVIIGYVMLGGLISIFANKLARRS